MPRVVGQLTCEMQYQKTFLPYVSNMDTDQSLHLHSPIRTFVVDSVPEIVRLVVVCCCPGQLFLMLVNPVDCFSGNKS